MGTRVLSVLREAAPTRPFHNWSSTCANLVAKENEISLLLGVRVVEMGLWVAAPSAGSMLADWGAEVIKIETPAGDPTRNFYASMWGSKETRSPPFELYNRSKRSVSIDIAKPGGLDAAKRVIGSADTGGGSAVLFASSSINWLMPTSASFTEIARPSST